MDKVNQIKMEINRCLYGMYFGYDIDTEYPEINEEYLNKLGGLLMQFICLIETDEMAIKELPTLLDYESFFREESRGKKNIHIQFLDGVIGIISNFIEKILTEGVFGMETTIGVALENMPLIARLEKAGYKIGFLPPKGLKEKKSFFVESKFNLSELYEASLEHGLIVEIGLNTRENFIKIFSEVPLLEIQPIAWHNSYISHLIYFILKLCYSDKRYNNEVMTEIKNYRALQYCFVKKDGSRFNGANLIDLTSKISRDIKEGTNLFIPKKAQSKIDSVFKSLRFIQ